MSDTYRVYKFGGASVKDAASVRNVSRIIEHHAREPMIVVVSAMGKMTNALENVISAVIEQDEYRLNDALRYVIDFHIAILGDLFQEGHVIWSVVQNLFDDLRYQSVLQDSERYGQVYDRIIGFGEMLSTQIVHHYLIECAQESYWHSAHELVVTNGAHRRATVDFEMTSKRVAQAVRPSGIHIVQGFLGAASDGVPTTLGREGSDYTAAVMAYVLDAAELCIWKDVGGVLTGDPKVFDDVVRLETISFREAIELAYYGASVIHPKTIQPLQRKEIPLYVKSFVDPLAPGTVIQKGEWLYPMSPCFIRKENQVLITLSTRDLAFIVEDHLSKIYQVFHDAGIAVNTMQNSAISSSFCINHDPVLLPGVLEKLSEIFNVKHNDGLSLYTIRHYDKTAVQSIRAKGEVYLEQVTRHTHQLVLKETAKRIN